MVEPSGGVQGPTDEFPGLGAFAGPVPVEQQATPLQLRAASQAGAPMRLCISAAARKRASASS